MTCGACRLPIRASPTTLVCHFRTTGFAFKSGYHVTACGTAYHRECFRAGGPFTCRTRRQTGLRFPLGVHWPLFVCECCTVRAVVGRELGATGDRQLLRLERVRILDVANSWSQGTFKAYKPKLAYMAGLERRHPGLQLLARPNPAAPPVTPAIAIAWAELLYSLRPSKRPDRDTVAFGTVRQLRSAASWYHNVATLTSTTGLVYDERGRRFVQQPTLAPQEAILSRFTEGLRKRLGDNPRPSYALLERHIHALDAHFRSHYRLSTDRASRAYWARAGLANTLLWLGWLRSSELFDLRWCDIEVIRPDQGPAHDLPPGVGCLLLRLNPITKTSPHHTADVPIAYATASGLRPGAWLRALRAECPQGQDSHSYIFTHDSGLRWDSHSYRHDLLYPVLADLSHTDPYLSQFMNLAGARGLTLAQAFYSLHCYRRGARTHVDLPRRTGPPRASKTQVYEHSRWTRTNAGQKIDDLYRQLPLYERIKITLFNM